MLTVPINPNIDKQRIFWLSKGLPLPFYYLDGKLPNDTKVDEDRPVKLGWECI